MGSCIELQAGDPESFREHRSGVAAHEGSDPREQLAEGEGLGQVVVGTAVEAGDTRIDTVTCGEHQDRNRGDLRSQLSTHVQTVPDRQHYVQDDGIVADSPSAATSTA